MKRILSRFNLLIIFSVSSSLIPPVKLNMVLIPFCNESIFLGPSLVIRGFTNSIFSAKDMDAASLLSWRGCGGFEGAEIFDNASNWSLLISTITIPVDVVPTLCMIRMSPLLVIQPNV